MSASPILLFLPTHHETEILDAYRTGVDECIVKPISPAIFLAKVTAWSRHSDTVPTPDQNFGKLSLDPARRIVLSPDGKKIKLANLEFRLLHLLMSRPGYVFKSDEIILAVWGMYGQSDQTALKNVVYRLRKKLDGGEGYLIQTSPGGYSFRED